jgi:hypothetical protein
MWQLVGRSHVVLGRHLPHGLRHVILGREGGHRVLGLRRMLEIRVERLLTRGHNRDGGQHINTWCHWWWHRCGWQIESHYFIKLDSSSTDRAQYGTVFRVHEVHESVKAICMNLVVDVTGKVNNLFVRLEIQGADWALAELVVDSKQVDHPFACLVSHLGDELSVVTFLSLDSGLLFEFIQFSCVFNFPCASFKIFHIIQLLKLVLNVVNRDRTPLEIILDLILFTRIAAASECKPQGPCNDPKCDEQHMLHTENDKENFKGYVRYVILTVLELIWIFGFDFPNQRDSQNAERPIDGPLGQDPPLKRLSAASLKKACLQTSNVAAIKDAFPKRKT